MKLVAAVLDISFAGVNNDLKQFDKILRKGSIC